jgi:hypothetical protein
MMPRTFFVALFLAPLTLALDVLPPHFRGGAVWDSLAAVRDEAARSASGAQYLTVPLDHFSSESKGTWQLKYFVDDDHYAPGGVLLVTMPSEGATGGCYGGTIAQELRAACICSQHRFFGDSVPNNDSSTAALRDYLSVEQNLADIAALISHARSQLYPGASATVVRGGSCMCMQRLTHSRKLPYQPQWLASRC